MKSEHVRDLCLEVCIMACVSPHIPELYEVNIKAIPLEHIICKLRIDTDVLMFFNIAEDRRRVHIRKSEQASAKHTHKKTHIQIQRGPPAKTPNPEEM